MSQGYNLAATFNNVTTPLVTQCYAAGGKSALLAALTELQAAVNALNAKLTAEIVRLSK